jgi:hypothetical protein
MVKMTIQKIILIVIIAEVIGILGGILLRLIRAKIPFIKLHNAFFMAIKYLIVLPIFLPFVIMRDKGFLINETILQIKKVSNNDKIEEIRVCLAKKLSFPHVFRVAFNILIETMIKNFDKYVISIIRMIKRQVYIELSKKEELTYTTLDGCKDDNITISEMILDKFIEEKYICFNHKCLCFHKIAS